VVVQIAQLMQAARLIEAETPMGRRLLAAWSGIDSGHLDMAAYTKIVAGLEPAEVDYQAAFRSLLGDGE
jgi:hypothetical protein